MFAALLSQGLPSTGSEAAPTLQYYRANTGFQILCILYQQHEHGPGIDFHSFSSLKSKGKYLFVDYGKLKSMKSYEKMGR